MCQVADVLHFLHQPKAMRAGMTWQLIYQDLKPANLLISSQDRVTVIDLGGCQLLNLDTNQKLLPGAATPGGTLGTSITEGAPADMRRTSRCA
jgi:serine/threonine protein kinase